MVITKIALLASVGPIAYTAARVAARRLAVAPLLVDPVPEPQLLARRRIECGDDALPAGAFVEDAVRHDRRRFALELRKHRIAIALRGAAERGRCGSDGGLPAPRDLQVLEIVLGDLIERRIARAERIGVEIAPLAGLRGDRGRRVRRFARQSPCRNHGRDRDQKAEDRKSRACHGDVPKSRAFWLRGCDSRTGAGCSRRRPLPARSAHRACSAGTWTTASRRYPDHRP